MPCAAGGVSISPAFPATGTPAGVLEGHGLFTVSGVLPV